MNCDELIPIGITEPEVIMCVTAHPAFNKAAHYLGIKLVIVPADDNAWAVLHFCAFLLYRERER